MGCAFRFLVYNRRLDLPEQDMALTDQELARLIDHTLLKAEATAAQIDRLCAEARQYNFYAVCVNPVHVAGAVRALSGSRTVAASVAGFPLGASQRGSKMDEARRALDDGAREIDMVLDIGGLIEGRAPRVTDDIRAVAEVVHRAGPGHMLKVILETAVLSPEQNAAGCRCCVQAGADFVKTSTGFHPAGGATVEAVRLLRKHAPQLGVKAAGGIRDRSTALAMVEAGATRLGTSASVAVVKGD